MSVMAMMSPPMGMHDSNPLMMPNPALLQHHPYPAPLPQYRRAIPGSPFDFPSPSVSLLLSSRLYTSSPLIK